MGNSVQPFLIFLNGNVCDYIYTHTHIYLNLCINNHKNLH